LLAGIVERKHIVQCTHLFASITGEENLKIIVTGSAGVVCETLMDLADESLKLGGLQQE